MSRFVIRWILCFWMVASFASAKPREKASAGSNPAALVLQVWPYEKTVGTTSKVKGVFKKDSRTVTVRCGFLNKSPKEIRAVRGTLRFTTYFNELIHDMSLEAVMPIKPGQRAAMNWKLKRKNFGTDETFKTFVDTPLEKMTYVWAPAVVVFADGSEIRP